MSETITVGSNQWTITIARTTAELIAGLSGIASIPANTGILFDLGSDRDNIVINMSEMLFNLDIAFINSTSGVVGILRNVAPGDGVTFDKGSGLGARYFLEVNAGEMVGLNIGDGVVVGDSVVVNGDRAVQPAFWVGLMVAVVAISQIAIVSSGTYKAVRKDIKEAKE